MTATMNAWMRAKGRSRVVVSVATEREQPETKSALVSQGARSERMRPIVSPDEWLRQGRRGSVWEPLA